MNPYEELYIHVFAAMADAVEELEGGRTDAARQTLIAAMQNAEEAVLAAECPA